MAATNRSAPGGVKDHAAVDVRQIELIIKTAVLRAVQAAMPEVEAVLRETYPEIPEE